MKTFLTTGMHVKEEMKFFGIPRDLLPFLARAFNTEVKKNGTSEWVTVDLLEEKEVTFFGN